ncbi:NAD(P)H-hydrate dehydratase [Herbaspirillum sp. RTI4]|uniref:NAD(P)H-hydrate dehydratase n=1 Tax=Herbaspirillum sp. RTI4 TaxID=3048640 RepID=UPI002AB49B9F|nr:NAD(P)H-hydrate dehydratase [Herbaspirillum sp. RTI4]MDY7579043.1 NAD(P)H-hydrate dehydratase [Herbaspirillum sp. RTI4]MEA9982372.1 NAD(P)H-hydrate dehydratase [Herbaspirillum sp. RTI4]
MPLHSLYSLSEIRAIEQTAGADLPLDALMQRAGQACAETAMTLCAELPSDAQQAQRILILAGPGNNGGDALETAYRLKKSSLAITVLLLGDPLKLPAAAQAAWQRASDASVEIVQWTDLDTQLPFIPSLVIDGLFGIGLSRPLEGAARALIVLIDQLHCPVLAIDVPSGLDADTGSVVGGKAGCALRATRTLTMLGDKPGLHTGDGPDYCGHIEVAALGLDMQQFPAAQAYLTSKEIIFDHWPARRRNSHKGSYGDLIVVGGADGMSGAPLLAARSALYAGAGRVFAAFAGAVPAFDPGHPELMCRDAHTLDFSTATLVIGTGLGTSRHAADLLVRALHAPGALVIDADALNLISGEPGLQHILSNRRSATILTPHPLEAARLLGWTAAEIQSKRLHAARLLTQRFNAVVILKGAGTVIAAGKEALAINSTGNPGLATAGTGDVLAGLCGALLAQHMEAHAAAVAAVWLHGAAADALVAQGIGPVGLTASELPVAIRRLLNER